MKENIAIKVEGLSKAYKLYNRPIDRLKESIHVFRKKYHRDFYALRDVSFEVKKGECLGIIGKNGSGKSTLLKMITGVLTPTDGRIEINGNVSALLELGIGFNPEMTGIENVYFNGAIMGYDKKDIDRKINDIISFADIGEFIQQPVKTYSTGMFVRLAFAVAINVNPDILIIDESLAVGDMGFQAKCYHKFMEFKKSGKTIIFVTHALDTIIQYCSKGIVLSDGEKICEANPNQAVDIYKKIIGKCSLADIPEEQNSFGREDPFAESLLKDKFSVSPIASIYGNNKAQIIDFGIFDENNRPVQTLVHNRNCSIRMKVKFNDKLTNPIFAYTIKDLKGFEITGTNTLYRHIYTGNFKAGDLVLVQFDQVINIHSGAYSLSLGCTGFEAGEFVIYSRLYDILLFDVISDVQMVGLYDLGGRIVWQQYAQRIG
jgi:teichoic acid transport system ATP-binding protein